MTTFTNIRDRLWGNAQYKFSIIFCSLYVVIFYGKKHNPYVLIYILISILLSIGIAGIGYAFNDFHDYKDDLKNNKQNIFLYFSKAQSIILVFIFLFLSIYPWFILPFNKYSLALLIAEFTLFIIYTLPPFRLKERGLAGIITDALYAQVVPCILAVHTYIMIVDGISVHVLIFIPFILWLLFTGCRNILNHQIEDYDNDTNTNTNTFVTRTGIKETKKTITYLLVPPELIAFIALLYYLPTTNHIFCWTYLLFICIYVSVYFMQNKNNPSEDKEASYQLINRKLLNEFYEIHLPVLLLCYFSLSNPFFLSILALNLLIFMPIYYAYIKGFLQKYC